MQHRFARWECMFIILWAIKETPTSNSEAHLSPPLGDRPLVEEREEFFALSREEEKAVWALASSFSLGKEWKI